MTEWIKKNMPTITEWGEGFETAAPMESDGFKRELFLRFRDFVYERSGLYFPENRVDFLRSRLASRITANNLKGFDEYLQLLEKNGSEELSALFDSITTQETSFFRNTQQLKALQNHVLPEILDLQRKRGQNALRVWSAGCSTGEEPYTLAIIAMEVLKEELAHWDVQIHATDISRSALKVAEEGIYSEYTLRSIPRLIFEKYFIPAARGRFAVRDDVKRCVSFSYSNLKEMSDGQPQERIHIIFCRNVIIYFDDAFRRRIVNHFFNCLSPGGYLFLGQSESLYAISKAFRLIHFLGTIVYRKGENN